MNLKATRLQRTCIGALGALAVAAAIGAAPGAHANLISNGSFETDSIPLGGAQSFSVGGATHITDWTVTGPAGTSVSLVNGSFTQNGVSFPAEDGSQWVDLTGADVNSTEGVSQGVATTVGHNYQLSYFIGNTTGGMIFGTTSTVLVSLNGVTSFTDTNSMVSPTTQVWQQFTHDFVASATTTNIGFTNGDPSDDTDNGLDNIVLLDLGPSSPPSTIPEPATLALFGSALAGLAMIRRRKRKSR